MLLVLLLPGLLFALACRAPAPPGQEASSPDLPVRGRIYRSAFSDPLPAPLERLLVYEKRVVAEPIVWDFYGDVFRFPRATAIPGLQDAHGHLESLGETLETVDLTGCASVDEVVELVVQRAGTVPPGQWILGRGWDQTRWPGQAFPGHAPLSARVPDHPVFLERVDGHAAFVNARALEIAGIGGRELPKVPGGRIVTDAGGLATGVLVDKASDLVFERIPEPDAATRERRLLAAQALLLSQGVTCVHDMGTEPETLDALLRLEEDGRLKIRVLCYLSTQKGLPPAARVGRPEDYGPERKVRVVGAKMYVDGALGSRGAALLEPYSDAPDERGLLQMTAEEYAALLRQVVAAGLQPATHAIGDEGNRMVLDAYEAELRRDPAFAELRPRIEHAQVVALADLERFDRLGVIPSMQPTHATSDMRWAEARLGAERVKGSYAWRAISSERVPLALGSDFPVESSNPLLGLYAAITRQDTAGNPPGGWRTDQALTPAEALDGFTSGAAFAAREEPTRGTLVPGAFCDVTVLDVDPLTCSPEELLTARVLRTIVDGEVVYEAPQP
jgi:predicted amidohydrolase YtcJ